MTWLLVLIVGLVTVPQAKKAGIIEVDKGSITFHDDTYERTVEFEQASARSMAKYQMEKADRLRALQLKEGWEVKE